MQSSRLDTLSERELEGLALIGKDAMVPEGVRVGRGSVGGIGAKAEDFDGEELAAGTLLPSRNWFKVGA